MLVKRFEDLQCWREARAMTRFVYALTGKPQFGRDWRLVGQITGAGISAMNNIAEGFDCTSKVEARRFYGYARRTCSEVQSCLYVALDLKYIDQKEFNSAYEMAQKTRRLTSAWSRAATRG
ncbi:MAG: four helix bundle protein [Planctomycetes bacterium]|nr:four helix bundle protein [Planctomycetota bacterium]MBM4081628.1 four helix bundle protein [Planctomycetota bacterium]